MKPIWTAAASACLLLAAGCAEPVSDETIEDAVEDAGEAAESALDGAADQLEGAVDSAEDAAAEAGAAARLAEVLAHPRRDDDRARDVWRNPAETLAFFGIEPGMTVGDVLPGGGWYTRVLLPYVGVEGRYVALNYQMDVWERMYGQGWDEEAEASIRAWPETAVEALAAHGPEGANLSAYLLGAIPDSEKGQGDAVIIPRALHHLMRFDPAYLHEALVDIHDFLKPGGVAGVIQHRAPADETDERVSGNRGYMREADVIAAFEAAGFVLDASSEINANPADPADHEIGVWALPPSNRGPEEDRERLAAIGETDRMTLRFVKPE